ncbi:MAG: 2-amino-4-hydroxy-6-hydroxymethyldihydropteridine diphosphokinase [Candidatus Nanopelagicales bacterium]
MTRVALSIGANLGDRLGALQYAVAEVATLGTLLAVSDVYETDPVGGPEQPEYYNAVIVLETSQPPGEVLAAAQRAEQGRGRTREVRWGARTLDVDVLAYGRRVSADPVLTLPHPRALQRGFVMIPWAQIDPDFQLPDGRSVGEVATGLASDGVRRIGPLLRTVDP